MTFLCNFSCSTSCLAINVGADLSVFSFSFSRGFYFQCLIVLAVAYFRNSRSNTAGFYFVLIKCFVLYEEETLIINI